MFTESKVLRIVTAAMEKAGVADGESYSAEAIHKGVADAIYAVVTSYDFKRKLDEMQRLMG